MKKVLLQKVRLSRYFIIIFAIFAFVQLVTPELRFESGALTLFSVNSFLYGFYIAPILSGQKARIEELHKTVRSEANAIFAMVIHVKSLPPELRNQIQDMFTNYLQSCIRQRRAGEGEAKYEALITFCIDYRGAHSKEIDELLDKLVANQQNRTNFAMQMANKVYSNEWVIMGVLFSITLSFVILLDAGGGVIYELLAALLCTGLSMLIVILIKMSTLTHKKAKQVWNPYQKLIDSHFYRID